MFNGIGLTSSCDDQVTLEIETNPPKAKGKEQGSSEEAQKNNLSDGLPQSLLD